jgi:hypothetical protein
MTLWYKRKTSLCLCSSKAPEFSRIPSEQIQTEDADCASKAVMLHLEQWLHPDLASPIGSKFRGKSKLERVNNVQKPASVFDSTWSMRLPLFDGKKTN